MSLDEVLLNQLELELEQLRYMEYYFIMEYRNVICDIDIIEKNIIQLKKKIRKRKIKSILKK